MATKAQRMAAASTYIALRAAGVPTWITAGEAFRMTDGQAGRENDMSGENGYNLSTFVLDCATLDISVHTL